MCSMLCALCVLLVALSGSSTCSWWAGALCALCVQLVAGALRVQHMLLVGRCTLGPAPAPEAQSLQAHSCKPHSQSAPPSFDSLTDLLLTAQGLIFAAPPPLAINDERTHPHPLQSTFHADRRSRSTPLIRLFYSLNPRRLSPPPHPAVHVPRGPPQPLHAAAAGAAVAARVRACVP